MLSHSPFSLRPQVLAALLAIFGGNLCPRSEASRTGAQVYLSAEDAKAQESWQPHWLQLGSGERRSGHPNPSINKIQERLHSAFQVLVSARAGEDVATASAADRLLDGAEAALEQLRSSMGGGSSGGWSEGSLGRPPRPSSFLQGRAAASGSSRGRSKFPTLAALEPALARLPNVSGVERRSNESVGWFVPKASDVELVARWASEIAGSGHDGSVAAAAIRTDPGSSAQVLLQVAGKARLDADGEDRDRQTWSHLLQLHFEERRSHGKLEMTNALVSELADDYRRLQALRSMQPSELAALEEPDNFVHFFRGLSKHTAMAALQTVNGSTAASHSSGSRPSRILVFSCSYGDGHKSAAQAVASYLQKDSKNDVVQIVDTTTDTRFYDAGKAPSYYLYNNVILKRQWYRLQNLFDNLDMLAFGRLSEPCPAPQCNTVRKNKFRSVILESRPDAIITVYHMDLMPILEVAKDLGNLPVLHIATDMDTKMQEVFGERGPGPVYPRFVVGVPFNSQVSFDTTIPLARSQTFLSGYPVRSDFLQAPSGQMSQKKAREMLSPPGAKLVLVMTGGGGQDVPWPEALADRGIGMPLHVMVVAGRNGAAAERLVAALPNTSVLVDGRRVMKGDDPDVTVEVARDPAVNSTNATDKYYIGAQHLRFLMDHADAIITKPGGGTTSEVAYCGLPALFDTSSGMLHWEEFTVKAFEQLGLGARFSSAEQLPQTLVRALSQRRSRRLAEDPEHPGSVLQTGKRVQAEIQRLLEAQCRQCALFPETAAAAA